jgi:hypothetical protein
MNGRAEPRHEDVTDEDDTQRGHVDQQRIGGLAAAYRVESQLDASE